MGSLARQGFPVRRSMYGAANVATSSLQKSQNGWPASPNPADIDIVTVTVNLRNGNKTIQVARPVADEFKEIVEWWDKNVEPVETVYGYNYRKIQGYDLLSNHSSGTAVDINADKHGLGLQGTVTTIQNALISAKAATLGLKWGGDYRNRKDEMHFEVIFSPTLEGVRKNVAKYWWLGVIGLTVITGAVVYRKRFL